MRCPFFLHWAPEPPRPRPPPSLQQLRSLFASASPTSATRTYVRTYVRMVVRLSVAISSRAIRLRPTSFLNQESTDHYVRWPPTAKRTQRRSSPRRRRSSRSESPRSRRSSRRRSRRSCSRRSSRRSSPRSSPRSVRSEAPSAAWTNGTNACVACNGWRCVIWQTLGRTGLSASLASEGRSDRAQVI